MHAELIAAIPPPPFSELQLGPLRLHMYGLIIGVGIVIALRLFETTARWQGIDRRYLTPIALPAIIAGFIGARLYHVASRPGHFAENPADIVKIWEGGLGIWGGVLLGTIVGVIVGRRHGVPLLKLIDIGAPSILLAHAIGRWGNYFNQELFGRPTDVPWALRVEPQYRPEGFESATTFHPTFLYESLWNLLIMAVCLYMLRRWTTRCDGVVFAFYVAAYSAGRFFIEGLRIDEAHEFHGLRQNEWVALVLFVVAAAAFVWRQWGPATRWSRTA